MEERQSLSSFIVQLRTSDILVGRGTHSVRHPGNKEFRKFVQQHKEAYAASSRICEKDRIAREIFHELETREVRFLARVVDPTLRLAIGIPEGATAWIEIDNVAALEKIKQQLRDVPFPSKAQSHEAKKAARVISKQQQPVGQQQQAAERGVKPLRLQRQKEPVVPDLTVRSAGLRSSMTTAGGSKPIPSNFFEAFQALRQPPGRSSLIASIQQQPALPPLMAQSSRFAQQLTLPQAISLLNSTLPTVTSSMSTRNASEANQLSNNSLLQQAFLNRLHQQLLNTGLPQDQALDIIRTLLRRCPQVLVRPERISIADLASAFSSPRDGSILTGILALHGCIHKACLPANRESVILPPRLTGFQ